MGLDAESVIERRRLKRRVTIWRIAAVVFGLLFLALVVLGDRQVAGGWAVRTYYKPLANWIWGGSILMAIGGALSLSDRRYRVAAGARKSTPAAGVPAE